MTEPILLTPGPTIVPAPVREALARPMIHHRTSDFQKILKEVGEGLKALFGTAQEVLILTSSGTGAMEAAAANLLSPGDEVIVIRGGKFGERWGELCEAYGAKVIPLDSPWGKPLHLNGLKRLLAHHPKVKAVFATLCETSTGVCFPIREVRRAMGALPALLVVDAISGLGSDPYRMDEFGADVTVCGSQKGLMLPPGLAFIALSPRAWEAVKNGKSPKYYFDLARARKAWEKTDTPFTPGINLIVGLAASLRFILEKGLDRFTEEHGRDAKWIREQALKMGLSLFTDESCASSAVTTIKVPEGLDGKDLVKRIKAKGAHFAGGQGKELEGKVIRIATMGAVGEKEVQAGMKALEETLKELGWSAKVMTR